ncbi:MAG: metallophosphoesterase [Tatlockia sp.]|nr:metallophosphoesterase [Tatlockia sp.]
MVNNINKKDCVKIIQLTDTHLFSNDSLLFGVNCNKTFDKVIDHIYKHELHDTDLILLTGDLSQDESQGSYQYLLNAFKPFQIPVIWIPGNHDNLNLMDATFSKSSFFFRMKQLELKHWIFIFLNTQLEGEINGFINQDDFISIKNGIENGALFNKKIALIMHHHPVSVDTPLIDKYIINNQEELWKNIRNSNVELAICGHVHGDYLIHHNNVKIESAPATCFQFKKGSTTLDIENLVGYKIHYFEQGNHHSKSVIWDVTNEISTNSKMAN